MDAQRRRAARQVTWPQRRRATQAFRLANQHVQSVRYDIRGVLRFAGHILTISLLKV
jgi:hypothetical protein